MSQFHNSYKIDTIAKNATVLWKLSHNLLDLVDMNKKTFSKLCIVQIDKMKRIFYNKANNRGLAR